jgi:hypothetical protein
MAMMTHAEELLLTGSATVCQQLVRSYSDSEAGPFLSSLFSTGKLCVCVCVCACVCVCVCVCVKCMSQLGDTYEHVGGRCV